MGASAEELHTETTLLELLQHWRGPGIVTGDVHQMFIACSLNIFKYTPNTYILRLSVCFNIDAA